MLNLLMKPLSNFLLIIADLLLPLRYKISWKGLDEISTKCKSGIIFAPNHPAMVDPVILSLKLRKQYKPMALADAERINIPIIKQCAERLGLITIPNLAKTGKEGEKAIHSALEHLSKELNNGRNVLVYPSGRLYRSPKESLRASSSLAYLLKRAPNAQVIVVRTEGLWGSRFSYASGKTPQAINGLLKGLFDIIKSGIFFLPKRNLTITFQQTPDLPRDKGLKAINTFLEEIYNKNPLANTYVPYSCWGDTKPIIMPEPTGNLFKGSLEDIPESTRKIIKEHLKEIAEITEIHPDQKLGEDLGIDSLRMLEVINWLEQEFGVQDIETDSLTTVLDVMLAACSKISSASDFDLIEVPARWHKREKKLNLVIEEGKNIAELFLKQAARTPGRIIYADQKSGCRSARQTVLACLLISPVIKAFPGSYVGIMLPASVGGAIFYLATLFAGKIPVMINWTVGKRSLEHSIKSLGIEKIITARALCTTLQNRGVHFESIENYFVYAEDLKGQLSIFSKLRALLFSYINWQPLKKAKIADTAVVLFTSGSESLPKAVPLSHKNITSNLYYAFKCVELNSHDRLCGFLPPFHSFGLSICVIAPAISGLQVVYHPKPTDGALIGKMIELYQVTMLVGTPSFLNGIVQSSNSESLQSLKIVVTGAEACPDKVYQLVEGKCPQASIIEGYGITECSPIVSANPVMRIKRGSVGKPLQNIAYKVIDPDTLKLVPEGERGMLIVKGDSIFSGYLNYEGPSPFIEFSDGIYYKTGDLVRLDQDHYIIFAGRLKRFIKIGGEMISLPAIEDCLQNALADRKDPDLEGPILAVEAIGEESKEEITLFSTINISREESNAILAENGFSPLSYIRRISEITEIPTLGNGKIDYKKLKSQPPLFLP
jgi:long-chain-fatty-acid--[acyl-carrier-protein] ligase